MVRERKDPVASSAESGANASCWNSLKLLGTLSGDDELLEAGRREEEEVGRTGEEEERGDAVPLCSPARPVRA